MMQLRATNLLENLLDFHLEGALQMQKSSMSYSTVVQKVLKSCYFLVYIALLAFSPFKVRGDFMCLVNFYTYISKNKQ